MKCEMEKLKVKKRERRAEIRKGNQVKRKYMILKIK